MALRPVEAAFLLAAAFAAASTLFGPLATADPGGGGFNVRPAHSDPAVPATSSYFLRRVARGGWFRDQVIVGNPGPGAVTLRVSAVDGLTGVTSGAVYANRQDRVRRDARWVRPDGGVVTVAPGTHVAVGFTVRVPLRATVGDHLAGLAFEDAQRHQSRGRFSVIEIVREVVGIEIQVPGRTHYRLDTGGVALRPLPGTRIPSLVVRLRNYGNRLCQPRLRVSLARAGSRPRTAARQLGTILPRDAISFPFPWPRPLRAGRYTAVVRTSRCGRPRSARRTATLRQALSGTVRRPG